VAKRMAEVLLGTQGGCQKAALMLRLLIKSDYTDDRAVVVAKRMAKALF